MLISCEKCSTTYVLEDRLIPIGGAPVQCTRCSHIFIAYAEVPPTNPNQVSGQAGTVPPGLAPRASPGTPAPSEPRRTQMFGAITVPNAQAPSGGGTQIFGRPRDLDVGPTRPYSVDEAQRAIDDARAAVTDPGIPAVSRTQTPMYGVPASEPEQQDRHSKTQIFGIAELNSAPQPRPSPAAPTNGHSVGEPKHPEVARPRSPLQGVSITRAPETVTAPSSKTQIFGVAGLDLKPEQPPEPAPAPASKTQIFGIPNLGPSPAPQDDRPTRPTSKTQIFGVPDLGASPAPASERVAQPGSKTQIFGAVDLGGGQREPETLPPTAPAPVVPRRPEVASNPVMAAQPARRPSPRVELPPAATIPMAPEPEDPALVVRAQLKRRNRIALLLGIAVVLAVAGFFGARLYLERAKAPSAEAVAARDAAISLLRRDDAAARDQAVAALESLAQSHPDYVEGRAALLLALVFKLDDARLEIRRINASSEELQLKIARLKEAKAPEDWEARVNALIDELAKLKAQSDPLIDAASELDAQVNAVYRALAASPGARRKATEVDVLRATTVYFGVKGADQALSLAERYRTALDGNDDGWAALALAEYAANAPVSPDTLAKAHKDIQAVRKGDSTFLRTWVLSARLSMAQKRYDAALGDLEALLLLNPNHEIAKMLAAWVKQTQAAAQP